MEAVKLNDNQIKVVTQAEAPAPTEQVYDVDFLISQRAKIIADANNYLTARKRELDEVQALLDKCSELGITEKVMPQPLSEKEKFEEV